MTQRERIYRALSERDQYDLRELVSSINSYSGGLTELEFWPMDELTDWLTSGGEDLDSSRLDDLLRQTRNGEFDERASYFRFDSWGDPVSSDGDYSASDIDDIAEYIDDNADDLPYWGLSDGLADTLTPDEIGTVLVDWAADCERPLPYAYDVLALRCAQEAHPADPCDVRAWAARAFCA